MSYFLSLFENCDDNLSSQFPLYLVTKWRNVYFDNLTYKEKEKFMVHVFKNKLNVKDIFSNHNVCIFNSKDEINFEKISQDIGFSKDKIFINDLVDFKNKVIFANIIL